MEDNKPIDDLNVSLEDHLFDSLRTVSHVLPADIVTTLRPYLSSPPRPPTIPYSVLLSVSKWSRGNGAELLRAHKPPLNPNEYSMVALLAGTKTSPERNFGTYTPPKDPHQVALERKAERKAITALLNSILSVLGSGFAAWWAADKTGWKNEWKVLLGLLVAIIVASAEAILYIIWQHSKHPSTPPKRRPKASIAHKKDDGPEDVVQEEGVSSSTTNDTDKEGLRRRQ